MSAGAVGMEVERPTDRAVGPGRDAAETTTASSTDTTATGAGVMGMEVERSADGAVGAGRGTTGTTTGTTTASSTDTTATDTGVVRMEVSTDTTAAAGAGVDGAAVGAPGGGANTTVAPKAIHARRDAAKVSAQA